jgi:dTDP-4-amino-4,6-dideoxygalactose transaminase
MEESMSIPFNKPYTMGKELTYIAEVFSQGHLAGNGVFTQRCQRWLQEQTGSAKALLTHSCTAALEMAAILADIHPGDEIIMPSFTFVSTANAFVLRGGVPVFVDIRPDTLNLDETKIESAITPRTKAIVAVHYAGVACDMDAIMEIASKRNLLIIEDDAQGILSTYKDRPLGSLGHLAALSFHETKNVISGEGGALLINDPRLVERAEIIWEKGTNRSKYFRGEVDKYTWVDIGSSFLPSELNAACLWAQLECVEDIIKERRKIWELYHQSFDELERAAVVRRPVIPDGCGHNAHIYYLLLPDLKTRSLVLGKFKQAGIGAVFHYVPLHTSIPGKTFCRTAGALAVTEDVSDRLIRLPLWVGIPQEIAAQAVEIVSTAVTATNAPRNMMEPT